MKLLCYLYRLLIFLGVFSAPLQSKAGYVNLHESKFNDQIEFLRSSEEHEWVCFFYLKESNKLAATSYTSTSILDFSLRENPDLVDAWKKALDSGFPELWRRDPEFLSKLRNVWDYNFVNGTNAKLPNILLEPT
jgi:hypothetical protein